MPSGSHKRGAKKVFAYEQPHCEALCAKLAPVLDRWTPRPTPFKLKDLVIRIYDPKHPSAWRVCPSQIGATREWRADRVQEWLSAGLGHLAQDISISVLYLDETFQASFRFGVD